MRGSKPMKRTPLKRHTPLKPSLRPLRGKTGLSRNSTLKSKGKGLKKTKLKSQSKKRKEVEGPEYTRLRLRFLMDHPVCEGCLYERARDRYFVIRPSTEIQHKALRGKWLLRTETWAAVCREHGERCTVDNPWAYKSGLRMTREQIRLLEEKDQA